MAFASYMASRATFRWTSVLCGQQAWQQGGRIPIIAAGPRNANCLPRSIASRSMQHARRLSRELEKLATNPPPGISCFPRGQCINVLDASILGLDGTPYEHGIFKLEIKIPDNYPQAPPGLRFKTPVYHPNIDDNGRICLDLLKMPPEGSWRPVVSLESVLLSIQQLLGSPNPDDPLMADIAEEFRFHKTEYEKKARSWTKEHAN